MVLEKINGPQDIKQLNREELHTLADETRHYLLQKVSEHGGHIGPNLAMVEATVALSRGRGGFAASGRGGGGAEAVKEGKG